MYLIHGNTFDPKSFQIFKSYCIFCIWMAFVTLNFCTYLNPKDTKTIYIKFLGKKKFIVSIDSTVAYAGGSSTIDLPCGPERMYWRKSSGNPPETRGFWTIFGRKPPRTVAVKDRGRSPVGFRTIFAQYITK